MEILWSVLSWILKMVAALIIFGIIILVHEFGHFIVAKLNKVRVNEFAIGMGPTLFNWGTIFFQFNIIGYFLFI